MYNKGLCGFVFLSILSYCISCSSLKNKNKNQRPHDCFILGNPSVGECEQEALIERVTQRAVTALSLNISCELKGRDASGRTGPAPGILSGRQLCRPYTYTGQLQSQLSFGVNHTAGDAVNRPTWGNLIPGSLLIFTAGPFPRSDN